jgi:hypothetical protein
MKWIRGHISIVFRVDPEHGMFIFSAGSDFCFRQTLVNCCQVPIETYRSHEHTPVLFLCAHNVVLGPELVIIDRVKKITQILARSSDDDEEEEHEPTDEEIQDEVSICFNSNIVRHATALIILHEYVRWTRPFCRAITTHYW